MVGKTRSKYPVDELKVQERPFYYYAVDKKAQSSIESNRSDGRGLSSDLLQIFLHASYIKYPMHQSRYADKTNEYSTSILRQGKRIVRFAGQCCCRPKV